MLVRLLHLLGALAVIVAGGILALCAIQWSRCEDEKGWLTDQSEAVKAYGAVGTGVPERASPLLAAAQGFALYLNPPPPVQDKPVAQGIPRPIALAMRPPLASPKFKVRGTICADRPERSMALIWEPGARNSGRWVKEGAQVGHFVIHEIRPGSIVYLDGERLCEMAIEREAVPTMIVADQSRPVTPLLQTDGGTNARPTQVIDRPTRPTGNSSFTVGSARTSILD